MDRKLASIRAVDAILPIDGADAIEVAQIGGWKVVVKKGEFLAGDLAIYLEIDSWVPTELAPFLSKGKEPREYNGVKGERLRTVKLRGQISQGLLLPYTALPKNELLLNDGDDATELLGIQKWEPPVNAQLRGQARGNFPHFLRKTDQERVQNLNRRIEKEFDQASVFEVTLKLDGTSFTGYRKDDLLGVCSRNIDLKLDDTNLYATVFRDFKIGEALTAYGRNIAIQGEIMGPSVQGNRENLKKHRLYVFDIFDIDAQRYLNPEERAIAFDTLLSLGAFMLHAPVLWTDKLSSNKVDSILELAEGPSLSHPVREGIVFKRLDGEFSFKAISNKFLLAEK